MGMRLIEAVVVTMVVSSWLAVAVNGANHHRHGDETDVSNHRTKRSDLWRTQWSQWYNSDSPQNGEGDFETSETIQKTLPICNVGETIMKAECRLADSNDTFDSTTAAFVADLLFQACSSHGLICLNMQQSSGRCHDYEVRFLCGGTTSDSSSNDSLFPNFDFKIYIILAIVPVAVVTFRILWSCCCKEKLKRRRQRQLERRRRGHRGSTSSESTNSLASSPSQTSFDSALALPPPSYTDLFGARRRSGVFTISRAGSTRKCKACGKGILPLPAAGPAVSPATPTTPATTAAATANTAGSGRGIRRIYSFSGPSGATYLAMEDPELSADGAAPDADTARPVRGLRRIVSFSGPSGATVLALAEPVFPVCSPESATDGAGTADPDDVFSDPLDAVGKNAGQIESSSNQNSDVTFNLGTARLPHSSTSSAPDAVGFPASGDLTSVGAVCTCTCHSQARQQGHMNLAFSWDSCDHVDTAAVPGRPPGMHMPVFGFSRMGSITSFTSFTSFTSLTEPPDYEEALEILRKSGLLLDEEKTVE